MELLGKEPHTKLGDKRDAECSKNHKKQHLSCRHKPEACAVVADVCCSLHGAVGERHTEQCGGAKSGC